MSILKTQNDVHLIEEAEGELIYYAVKIDKYCLKYHLASDWGKNFVKPWPKLRSKGKWITPILHEIFSIIGENLY